MQKYDIFRNIFCNTEPQNQGMRRRYKGVQRKKKAPADFPSFLISGNKKVLSLGVWQHRFLISKKHENNKCLKMIS